MAAAINVWGASREIAIAKILLRGSNNPAMKLYKKHTHLFNENRPGIGRQRKQEKHEMVIHRSAGKRSML